MIGVRLVYTFVAASLILRRSAPGHAGTTGPPALAADRRFSAGPGCAAATRWSSPSRCRSRPPAGEPFPARGLIIFLTFAVILATLVLQGLTLAPLIRWWGLTEGGAARHRGGPRAPGRGRGRTPPAPGGGQARRRGPRGGAISGGHLRRAVQRWSARDRERHGREDEDHAGLAGVDGSRAERLAVGLSRAARGDDRGRARGPGRLRDQGVIGDDVLRRVQRDLDLETMLLESADDGAPQSPYEVE